MGCIVGVDAGEAFADAVVIDKQGEVTTAEALTTPPRFSEGILTAG